MPKKSVILRNQEKRRPLIRRLREQRNKLRVAVSNIHLNDKERREAMRALQELPRDSSPSRERNRCKLCSRPRAYNRLTGLCRLHMRSAVINGLVPGMRKASW